MSDKIVHFDICGPDISPLSTFYSDLFGWKVSDADGGYAQVETGNGLRGGLVESDLANVTFGIQVDDLDSMLERAQQLGGTIEMPATDNGWVVKAQVRDPAGNLLSLIHSGQKSYS